MKILVTGWNGRNRSFIPKQVASHLIAAGHEVDGWEWDEYWEEIGLYAWTYDEDSKTYIHAVPDSVRTSPKPFSDYDLIIHLGANSSTTENGVEKVLKQNFDFSLYLLNYCQKHKIPLHYASSASVYGNTTHFQEEGSCSPKSPYAWSKYMFDRIVQKYGNTFSTPVIGFRYFNVYGFMGEEHKGEQSSVVYKWYKSLIRNAPILSFDGYDDCKRDFVYIKDICKVHEKMLDVNYTGIVNVGSGTARSFSDVISKFEERFPVQRDLIDIPDNIKQHYQKYTCSDNTTLNSLIDHKFMSLEETFELEFGM
jgi:ADP-L-glycero-D-manno-heptose 6-epimerase